MTLYCFILIVPDRMPNHITSSQDANEIEIYYTDVMFPAHIVYHA